MARHSVSLSARSLTALVVAGVILCVARPVMAAKDLVFVVDGSGSISDVDWQIQKDGISAALQDATSFPRDGSISVGLVQFSFVDETQRTRVEIPLTAIGNETDAENLVMEVQAIDQLGALTNPGDGVRRSTELLLADGLDPSTTDWTLCMSTDGITNSGEALADAVAFAQSNNVDKYSVIAIEDPPFADGASLRAHYGPHVFGGGSVTVARNSIEFASLIAGACLGSAVELRAVEVSQAVQDWHNSVPLVTSKPTTVRAFVQVPTGNDPQTVVGRLFGTRAGLALPGSPLLANNPASGIVADEDIVSRRGELDDSLNFVLPDSWLNGTVELEFDAAGAPLNCQEPSGPGSDPSSDCRVTVSFQDETTPDIVFVGVSYKNAGGTVIAPSAAELSEQHLRFQSLLPLASINFSSDTLGPYDAKPSLVTVNTDLLLKRDADGSSAFYYGVLDGFGGGRASGIPGLAASGYLDASGAVGGTGYARNRGPHEWAHDLGRSHAADAALPLTAAGFRQGRCGSVASASADPHTPFATVNGAIRPVIGPLDSGDDAEIWGLDNRYILTNTSDLAVIDPRTTFAVMGYCKFGDGATGPHVRWISQHTYEAVMGTIAAGAAGASGGASGDFVMVRGTVDLESDSVTLTSPVELTTSPSPVSPGPFHVGLMDGSGNELVGADFEPLVMEADTDEDGNELPPAGVVLVPLPKPAAPIAQIVVTKNGVPVGSATASANTPSVSIVSPAGGELFTGETVSFVWSGNDADGDPISYSAFYSANDGASWTVLATGLDATTLTVARSQIPGSSMARFQVQGSDGVNIGLAVSNPFTVGNNAPEVIIHNPSEGQILSGLQSLELRATAFDREDGQLAATSLVWSSDVDGSLGTGDPLTINAADLTEGTHVLTASAADAQGNIGSSAVTLRVFRVAPPPPIQVTVDIKPGSDVNPVNLLNRGLIPVAILGTDDFDVSIVDPATLAFGPGEAAPAHSQGGHFDDLNGDGLVDLLSHYRTQETGIAVMQPEACVTGETLSGRRLQGCDSILTLPACGIGFELALLLPPLMWLRRRWRAARR